MEDFNIGMTFTPTETIVIGLGLNSFIQGLFGTQALFAPASFPDFDFTISARIPPRAPRN